jgi:rRNA maturation protein Nop10
MPKVYKMPLFEEAMAIPVGEAPVSLDGATIRRCGEKIVLLAPQLAEVLVNGRPLAAGIRVLAHRDQIRAGAESWWFSAEDTPCVAPFPGAAGDVCPRCRGHIDVQSPAVRCACGNWLHQLAERPCFDYAAACPVCGRRTALDGVAAFSPED